MKIIQLDDVCSICYDDLDDECVETRCKHIYHGDCIGMWFYHQDTCPICRTVTRNEFTFVKIIKPINPLDLLNLLDVEYTTTPLTKSQVLKLCPPTKKQRFTKHRSAVLT